MTITVTSTPHAAPADPFAVRCVSVEPPLSTIVRIGNGMTITSAITSRPTFHHDPLDLSEIARVIDADFDQHGKILGRQMVIHNDGLRELGVWHEDEIVR